VNHTAWFTTFRRGDEDLIPRIREVMIARHVDETIPMLDRSDDPYQSNERVRAELMRLTGYFHTESSHHASEYWAWFRKTPELTRHYLDRHWDNLEVSAAADKAQSDRYIVDEARRDGIRHGGELAAPIMDTIVTGTPRVAYVNVRNGGLITNLPADACVEVASVAGRRELVHAAVALDPLTGALQTLPKIREMTDRMLEAEAEWLPQFTNGRT